MDDAGRERFAGAWRLLSYKRVGSRGRVLYPLGEEPAGYIVYGAGGYMSVAIMSAGRVPFAGVDFRRATLREAAESVRTYLSYAGRYEVLPDRVLHHVEVSLFPNWVGSTQERFYRFDGDRLELSTAPFGSQGVPLACLLWERASR